MNLEDFSSCLEEEYGFDVWEEKLKEQSKNIVNSCLESV